MNLWHTFFLSFSLISLFLAFFLFFKKKGNRAANIILGFYLLLFSYNLVYNVLYWSGNIFSEKYINLFGTLAVVWILYPTLIYLYIKSLLTKQKLGFVDIIHFVPTLTVIFIFSRLFAVTDGLEKLMILRNGQMDNYIYVVDYYVLGILSVMVIYSVIIYRLYINSEVNSLNIRLWLKCVIGCFYAYVSLMILYFVLLRLNIVTVNHDYVIMLSIVLFIGLVAYFGHIQPDVFLGLPMHKVLPFRKYMKTGLSESLSLELKDKLLTYMENEKPYLNSEIRLDDIAQDLNLSRHHTSQIINEHFDVTFFFFINSYRVNEAKALLVDRSDLNITEVIFLSGFNNRVSFYKAFKIHTNLTPKEYRNQYLIQTRI